MPDTKGTIIELTEEQKKQMREATGTEHQAIRVEVGTRLAAVSSGLRPGGKGGLRPGGKGGLRPGGKGGLRPGGKGGLRPGGKGGLRPGGKGGLRPGGKGI